MRNLADRRTRLGQLLRARWTARRRRSRPSPRSRASCSPTSTRRSRRSPASRAPTCRTRSPTGPPARGRGDREPAQAAPVPAPTSTRLLRRAAARASRRCRRRAPRPRRRVHDRHAGAARARVALNQRLKPTFASLQSFAAGPARRARRQGPDADREHRSTRRSRYLTPTQTVCNYVTLFFRNAASLLSRRRPERHRPALHRSSPRRRAPTTRAARPRAPGQRARPRDNYLHANPYPNTAAPGPDAGVRGRQRDLRAGQAGHRQRPGQPGHERDRRSWAKTEP